jgi:hypothetical protein
MPYSFPLLARTKFEDGLLAMLSKDLATVKLLVAGINLLIVPPPSSPPLDVVPYKVCACIENIQAKKQIMPIIRLFHFKLFFD